MVGPISQGERDAFNRKLQVGVSALVAVSTGMVALGAGASPVQAAAAFAGGVVVGAVIAWYAVPTAPAPAERQRLARENPFADGGDDGDDSEAESGRSRSATRRRRQ